MLKSDLHEVELPFGKTIFQFKNQGVSSDSKLLFDEIKQENLSNAFCLELGCGNGIISLMLAHYHPDWQIIAIDIQLKLIQLAKKNNRICETDVLFQKADLKMYSNPNKFDLIFANPPFFQLGMFRLGDDDSRNIARHEIECKLRDVLRNIKRNLKPNGKAYLIYPIQRLKQIETESKKVDLILLEKKNIKSKVITIFKLVNNER